MISFVHVFAYFTLCVCVFVAVSQFSDKIKEEALIVQILCVYI